MRVFLVRHGESLANVNPSLMRTTADHAIGLSTIGRAQATHAGLRLAAFLGDAARVRLWHSPYLRARETADEVERGLGDRVVGRWEHVLFAEQQFGLFEGVPDEELPKLHPAEFAHYQKCEAFGGKFWARVPLGESRFDVALRVHQAIGSLHRDEERHGVHDHVVVAHGSTLRAFVMMFLHRTPEWFEAEPNPENGSVRLIDGHEDRGYL